MGKLFSSDNAKNDWKRPQKLFQIRAVIGPPPEGARFPVRLASLADPDPWRGPLPT